VTFEREIEIRWRDVDALRHVNNAVYATYLEEGRDGLLRSVLGADAGWNYVLARVAIDFRRELRLDDERVVVSCRPARIGRSSITLREEIRTLGGETVAEAEAVIVVRDRESGRSRPLDDDERRAFEEARDAAV
jgi:acyl-CoA thioester hydrolase